MAEQLADPGLSRRLLRWPRLSVVGVMDEVVVGRGQGPGSSQAEMGGPDGHTHGESSGDAAAKLQAALADDTTLRERADPLVLRVFGEDVRDEVPSSTASACSGGPHLADLMWWF